MPRKSRDPFEVTLNDEERADLVTDLINGLEDAQAARSTLDEDAEYWMKLYEQQRTRLATTMPWPDAADLTSYLGTEKVDALHARLHRTVVGVEPLWAVEGWGEAASRAPIVEAFHHWKAEEERLQAVLDRVLLLSLIEPMGVLEVAEATDVVRVRERKTMLLAVDPVMGGVMLGDDGKPELARDPMTGDFIEAQPNDPSGTAEVVLDTSTRVRRGPMYKVIPFRDFYILPGHARDDSEIWGYAKRFYRRLPELQQKAKAGHYDKKAVDELDESGEFANQAEDTRSGISVIERSGDTAHKELWEFLVRRDFDDQGERWFLVTIHIKTRGLLRVQHDDLAARRFVRFVPIPRSDSVYGYSFIGEKLITVIEEHTAIRNMMADRASMAVNAPIKRLHNALWDPDEQPFGPKAVIDVRDMNEVQGMVLPDVPRGLENREREVISAAERLAGVNDVAMGTSPQADRTLGEVKMVTEQSFVRMDQLIRRIQESLEDLFQIRHLIYQRTLAENDTAGNVPRQALTGLENRGIMIPEGRITAEMLAGTFRGKPRGSVESADLNRKRADLIGLLQALPGLLQMWPSLQQQLATPQAAQAMLAEMVRVFRFENRQALLGPPQAATAPPVPSMEGLLGQFGQQGGPPPSPGPQQVPATPPGFSPEASAPGSGLGQ
jgi:hypothetical protein